MTCPHETLPSLNQAGIANKFDSSTDLGGRVLVESVLNDISSILTDLDC